MRRVRLFIITAIVGVTGTLGLINAGAASAHHCNWKRPALSVLDPLGEGPTHAVYDTLCGINP